MFFSSIHSLAFVGLVGLLSMIYLDLVDAACGGPGPAEFNADGTLPQGENGELFCAVRCILQGDYCVTNDGGAEVYPAAAKGSYEGDTAKLTDFYGSNISNWCVGLVKDFSYVFDNVVSYVRRRKRAKVDLSFYLISFPSQATFNQPLLWNTTSATDMAYMFFEAYEFNQPLKWDTKSVTSMSNMFFDAIVFNKDISSWDTTNVITFSGMFIQAIAFNQDISSWSVGASCDFSLAFEYATSFNQDLNPWEQQLVGKDCGGGAAPLVTDMFKGSGCPVQVATIPGDFCQLAPSAMPSISTLPSMAPMKRPTWRPTTKPTKPPARASKGAFNVRVCLADAVKHCSCKKRHKKNDCFNASTTACKAKYVAAGGAVNKFITLAKAAARHRKCDTDEVSG
jgi:surface protein